MKGKILGASTISGEDGKRYSFSLNDVRNLEGRSESELVGYEVDFEISGEEAKEIFIIRGLDVAALVQNSSIQSIKTKAYVYLACCLLALIPLLGLIFAIVALITLILALSNISSLTGYALVKHLILGILSGFVGGVVGATILLVSGFALDFSNPIGVLDDPSNALVLNNMGLAIGALVMLVGLLVAIYFWFRLYKNLSLATAEPLFIWAFVLRVVPILIAPVVVAVLPVVGLSLFVVAFISVLVELIAWIKFKELKKAPGFVF